MNNHAAHLYLWKWVDVKASINFYVCFLGVWRSLSCGLYMLWRQFKKTNVLNFFNMLETYLKSAIKYVLLYVFKPSQNNTNAPWTTNKNYQHFKVHKYTHQIITLNLVQLTNLRFQYATGKWQPLPQYFFKNDSQFCITPSKFSPESQGVHESQRTESTD